jgi:HPt (histidine-containing phosphotransfer) domain-containing protein
MPERIAIRVDPDIADLIPGFLDNRRTDVGRLRVLLGQDDFTEIRRIGHSMKGAGGGYGFDAITDLGAEIEMAALRGDVAAIEQLTGALDDYLARIDVIIDA